MMNARTKLIIYYSSILIYDYVYSIVTDTPDIDWSKINRTETLPVQTIKNNGTADYNIPQTRIIKGDVAAPNQFPHQVAIETRSRSGRALCGGSLISKDWVITAAHCLYHISEVRLIFGSNSLGIEDRNYQMRSVTSGNLIIHENYNHVRISNDIGLIRLPYSVQITDSVKPIKLPKINTVTEGRKVITSGWGKIGDRKKSSRKLLYIDMKEYPIHKCKSVFGSIISSKNICFDTLNGKSTCNGDSGGPAIINENGENILVGITSFGSAAGCEKGHPIVFTRVSSYLNWITKYTGIRS